MLLFQFGFMEQGLVNSFLKRLGCMLPAMISSSKSTTEMLHTFRTAATMRLSCVKNQRAQTSPSRVSLNTCSAQVTSQSIFTNSRLQQKYRCCIYSLPSKAQTKTSQQKAKPSRKSSCSTELSVLSLTDMIQALLKAPLGTYTVVFIIPLGKSHMKYSRTGSPS